MARHAFFFSYARNDRRACFITDPMSPYKGANFVDALFDELKANVQLKLGCPVDLAGYRDQNELQAGDIWPEKLADAVCSSHVLVALLTPNYLSSLNCGREFAVFQKRFELIEQGDFFHIVPIFWESSTNCNHHIPAKVRSYFDNVQQFGPNLPENYPAAIGLYDAWRMGPAQDRNKIVIAVAERIASMIRTCELPPLTGFRTFHELPSAFEPTADDRVRAEAAERPPSLAEQPPEVRAPGRPLPVLAPV